MQVALSEVLGALSYALDITEGEPPGHAVRTTAIGMRLGEHPRYTHQILARVACFRGIVETAANHHERLDGTGYHRGLAAFDLSRPARILAVADIYEALTADRPYREAMPRERALEIVREQRGTGLCPAAVDALEAAATDVPPWTAGLAQPAPIAPARGFVRPPGGVRR